MDKTLYAEKKPEELRAENEPLDHSFDSYAEDARKNVFQWRPDWLRNAKSGRRAELLKNPGYLAVLKKYADR